MIAEHPIVALATPYAKSPLALIRISGKNCLPLLYSLLWTHTSNTSKSTAIKTLIPQKATVCLIKNPAGGEILDQAVVTVYKSPKSYTGEDAAEISIHGGIISIEKVLTVLRNVGFADAEAGEFTKRAFINGKLDLTQAEAIHSIIEAQSSEAHTTAIHQLIKALSKKINEIKNKIMRIAAVCSVSLDYPDDEIQESTDLSVDAISPITKLLTDLLATYDLCMLQKEGVSVVLGGKTNAGKSSVFNSLIKKERAITSATHGTTRDYLEYHLDLRGIPIKLFDTAGLRTTKNTIEKHGVQKSYDLLTSAAAILFVVDSLIGWTEEDTRAITSCSKDNSSAVIIILWNKIDAHKSKSYIESIPKKILKTHRVIETSAVNYTGFDVLQKHLFTAITQNISMTQDDTAVIQSPRQKEHIKNCLEALNHVTEAISQSQPLDMISLDVDIALKELDAITGETSTEDILNIVFKEFCVGK